MCSLLFTRGERVLTARTHAPLPLPAAQVQVSLTEGEVSCLHQIIHGQSAMWDSSSLHSSLSDEREALVAAFEKLSVVCACIYIYTHAEQ